MCLQMCVCANAYVYHVYTCVGMHEHVYVCVSPLTCMCAAAQVWMWGPVGAGQADPGVLET